MAPVTCRYSLAVCGLLGCIVSYAVRSNISVALVAMVKSSNCGGDGSNSSALSTCNRASSPGNHTLGCTEHDDSSGEFDWNEELQGIILGGFFWGYAVPQLIGARLAEKFSAKNVVLVGGSVGVLATLLGPVAARTHVGLFIATRVMCGLGMSVLTPSCHCLIARWSHPTERSKIAAVVYSGSQIGVVIAMPVAGLVSGIKSDGGWPWAFYIFGILGIVWLVLWSLLVYDTPSEHPWISEAERSYIEDSLVADLDRTRPPVPWRHLAKSRAVWSLAWAHFGHNWGFYMLLTQLPTYMKNMLGFSLLSNGVYSSIPYILMTLNGCLNSVIADFLIKRRLMSIGAVRKMCNTVALYGSATFLLVITFIECDTRLIYALLVLAVGIDGGIYAGFQVNQVDLSPTFAGTLQAITNTLGCVPGILAPYVTGIITNGHQTHDRWSIVFFIAFGVMVFFATQFWIFGDGEVQYWNNLDEPDKWTETTPIKIEAGKNGGILAGSVIQSDTKSRWPPFRIARSRSHAKVDHDP